MAHDLPAAGWSSLRWRLPLLVTLPVATVMVLGVAAAHVFNVRHWAEIERDGAHRTARILTDTLDERLGQLSGTLDDDAQWDAAYAFLNGKNPGFTSSDLTQASLDKLNLAVLLMTDVTGTPQMAWGRDREGKSTTPTGEILPGGPLHRLVCDTLKQRKTQRGLVWYDGNAALFTAAPVVPTDGRGTPSGTIAFITRLDQPQLDQLVKRIDANAITITRHPPGEPGDDDQITLESDHLHITSCIPGLDGNGLAFHLNLPRHYTEGVWRTNLLFASTILIGGLATALMLAWLVHRFLVRRIITLVQTSRDWGTGQLAAAPPADGDELDGLARILHSQFQTIGKTCSDLDLARQQAENADRAKSLFLAAMSHDIRTPLNGMLGMAQLMQRGDLTPTQRERLETLIRSGALLLALLNDLLDVTKIEAGRIELEPVSCVLAHEIHDIADLLRPNLKPGVTLIEALAPDLPDRLLIDVNRLRQVLWNIAGNAAKFTASGHIRIAAEAAPGDDHDCRLTITISDSGPGIDPAERSRLFQPFSQATAGRRTGGTGLGLWISQRLAELMGGGIALTDAPEGGSIFTITFLAQTPDAEPSALNRISVPVSTASLAVPHRGLRVLVCDDDLVNQAVIHGMLSHFGAATILAGTGADALRCAAQASFDVILLDYRLPDFDGLEVAQRLRAAEAGTGRHTPIIGLTADVLDEDRQRLLAAGMDLVLTKPVAMTVLAETLTRYGKRQDDPPA